MDISRQVFGRSARMGIAYVVLSVVFGISMAILFDLIPRLAVSTPGSGQVPDLGAVLTNLTVPFATLAGLMITTPVYLLFVNDKNAGVLEYLLAVGMDQRDVFMGYLKAALMLSLLAMVPPVLVNFVLSPAGPVLALEIGALALVTGLADVALVTVLMTGFSSMQRRPTGMNSPLGIGVGIIVIFPEFILISALGVSIIWLNAGLAIAVLGAALLLLLSLGRWIRREKFLP